jgi:hypothetical protein
MAQDTWSLRVWQRALRDFLVLAINEGTHETEIFLTDGKSGASVYGHCSPAPDLRLLRSVPTTKISPVVRAFIRSRLKDPEWQPGFPKCEVCGTRKDFQHPGEICNALIDIGTVRGN